MLQTIITIWLLLLQNISSFTPPCTKCKWFIPNENGQDDHGFCKIFTHFHFTKEETIVTNEYASHCRQNEYQCGPEGNFFEPKHVFLPAFNNKFFQQENIKFKKLEDLREQLQEIKDLTSGEVNEKKELEYYDRKMIDLLQRITHLQFK
jgi:hypothetical protein